MVSFFTSKCPSNDPMESWDGEAGMETSPWRLPHLEELVEWQGSQTKLVNLEEMHVTKKWCLHASVVVTWVAKGPP